MGKTRKKKIEKRKKNIHSKWANEDGEDTDEQRKKREGGTKFRIIKSKEQMKKRVTISKSEIQ